MLITHVTQCLVPGACEINVVTEEVVKGIGRHSASFLQRKPHWGGRYLNLINFWVGGYRACHGTPVLTCVRTNSAETMIGGLKLGKIN